MRNSSHQFKTSYIKKICLDSKHLYITLSKILFIIFDNIFMFCQMIYKLCANNIMRIYRIIFGNTNEKMSNCNTKHTF